MGTTAAAFTHLHCHSYYSFLDGVSSPLALAERAAAMGQGALALTDWVGVYGAVPFSLACRSVGVRPILGAEIALTGAEGGAGQHLTLLVKDAAGWSSLCRLLTAAQLAGRKGCAPIAPALLAAHAVGLICLSGCRHGAVAAPLLAGEEAEAWRAAHWLRDIYRDDFWLEAPRNELAEDRLLTARLAVLAKRLGVGLVATANVHYATPDDGPLASVVSCIRAATTHATARHLRRNYAYHLAGGGEMAARVRDYPESIANTAIVASRCQFDLALGRHSFPAVAVRSDEPIATGGIAATPDGRLRALCRAGLTDKYADGDTTLWQRAAAQLDHELSVIADLRLAPFFLVVWDIVRFTREAGIPHQGRGSAAGSVVAYSLGISKVEPLQNNLLFERFLSRERESLPDIDIDFGHLRREEVIQYIYRTYGAAHVGMACTFQTYHTRGAVRDVGKVLGIPAPMLEAVAKRVRQRLDDSLATAVAEVVGAGAARAAVWRHFTAFCSALAGVPRHVGLHNGGLVISGPPLGAIVPLERAAMPGRTAVQWDKESLESAGLIKLDVLALQSLDLTREAVALARMHEGATLDLDSLPLDDPATYDLLCRADTAGCFQVESRAQMQFLPLHQPRTFANLVAQISIIRPGPVQGGMVHPYLRRRAGEEPVGYPHPSLEPVLRDSLGVVLWQEQVLEIARTLAGFSLGEGDELRRAMGSARSRGRMDALRERFVAGAARNGVAEDIAAEVFRQVAGFASYGFPRAHATAFARLAYETAYLRAHHLAAFTAARLNATPGGFYDPGVIVGDARRHGVRVLGPDLARSAYRCTLEREGRGGGLAVRLGLRFVRGLAEVSDGALVAARDRDGLFRDLADLCRRTRTITTPESIAALIAAGACDEWGIPRRALVWALPATWRGVAGLSLPVARVTLPAETPAERVAGERWATGLPISRHPVATQRAALAAHGVLPVAALAGAREGAIVVVAGTVAVMQAPPTAKGVMFVTLEDESGLGNLVFAPATARRCRAALHATPIVIVTGRVQRRGATVNLQVAEIASWRVSG